MKTITKCYKTEPQTEENFKFDLYSEMMTKPRLTRLKEIIFDYEFRGKGDKFYELLNTLYHTSSFYSIVLSHQKDKKMLQMRHQIFFSEYKDVLKNIKE